MAGASSGSSFCSDFRKTGNKPFEKVSILKINFFDVALTKITRHARLI